MSEKEVKNNPCRPIEKSQVWDSFGNEVDSNIELEAGTQ